MLLDLYYMKFAELLECWLIFFSNFRTYSAIILLNFLCSPFSSFPFFMALHYIYGVLLNGILYFWMCLFSFLFLCTSGFIISIKFSSSIGILFGLVLWLTYGLPLKVFHAHLWRMSILLSLDGYVVFPCTMSSLLWSPSHNLKIVLL